jgi:hypothetical protein
LAMIVYRGSIVPASSKLRTKKGRKNYSSA